MKSIRDSFFTVFGVALVMGIAMCAMSQLSSLESRLISISFIFVLTSFFLKLFNHEIGRHDLELFVLSVVLVFVNVSISGSVAGFNYYKKSIMYLTFILWLICSQSIVPNRSAVVLSIIIIIAINLSYLYFYDQGFNVYEGEVLLTLNFPNPNQAGLFILNSIMYLAIPIFAGRDLGFTRKFCFFLIILFVPLVIETYQIMFQTGCRSSILALFFYCVLILLDILLGERMMKIPNWLVLLIVTAPFILVFYYLAIAPNFALDTSFGIEVGGKTSTSRIDTWAPIINNIDHYLLFGDYYGISNGTGVSQLHNTHIDVLASYGLIPFILFVVILFRVLSSTIKRAKTRLQRIAIYAFISCLVSGSFEASLVSGSAGMFLLTVGYLIVANYRYEDSFIQ